jgi:hypothetical protein
MSNTFSSRHYLDGGDAVVVGKGVFHSTKVLSENGLFLLEIETPPCKTDLVRLSDNYGRELSGYEGVSEMVTANLESFGYFDFDESKAYSSRTHETDRFSVTIEVFVADEEFTRKFAVSPEGLYTSCRGALYDGDGAMILAPGDTQKCEALSAAGALHIQGKTILLKTVSRDK